jgi:anti-sigma-K factor RskA
MTGPQHDQIRELLGAYVLNATDAIEHRRVERHLTDCDDCANEVRLLREAAGELVWLTQPADAGDLAQRISTDLPARRRTWRARIVVGVAAVAVVVSGVLGASLVHERSVNSQLADVLATASRRVVLTPRGGFEGRGVLHVTSGRAALILEDVPAAGTGRTYQLWAIAGTKPRSMTVVDGAGRVVRLFDWKGAADRFAITIEPDGGSPVPTNDPVLLGN